MRYLPYPCQYRDYFHDLIHQLSSLKFQAPYPYPFKKKRPFFISTFLTSKLLTKSICTLTNCQIYQKFKYYVKIECMHEQRIFSSAHFDTSFVAMRCSLAELLVIEWLKVDFQKLRSLPFNIQFQYCLL